MTTKTAQQRLKDPDGHFPYKLDEARAAAEGNDPAGPNGPDDTSRRVQDFLTVELAEATNAYVDAQAEYIRDPGDGTRAAYHAARDDLTTARRAHRSGRPGAQTVEG